MKNKNIKHFVIFGGIGIILLAVFLLNLLFQSNTEEPEYEYIGTGYFYGSILKIDGIKYIEIDETMFQEIADQLIESQHESDFSQFIIKIEYPYVNEIWKYNIYGSKELEKRILLKGEEAYIFNDANYPEVYFCRTDIFNELMGELESLEGINMDIFLK